MQTTEMDAPNIWDISLKRRTRHSTASGGESLILPEGPWGAKHYPLRENMPDIYSTKKWP